MRKSGANLEIGPAITEPIACFVGGDVDRVTVGAIDLCQRLDQIDGVTFVASKLRPNGMSIDGDSDDRTTRIYMMGAQHVNPAKI